MIEALEQALQAVRTMIAGPSAHAAGAIATK
jgi:hypothetical protein